jgi:hypothetical protein
MWQVIDTQNDRAIVSTHPTQRKAFNASRKLEPVPSALDRLGNPDWRYLIRKADRYLSGEAAKAAEAFLQASRRNEVTK